MPFVCPRCEFEFGKKMEVSNIPRRAEELTPPLCNDCHEKAVFDDIYDHYIGFLENDKVLKS